MKGNPPPHNKRSFHSWCSKPASTFLSSSKPIICLHMIVSRVQDWSPHMSFVLKGSQILVRSKLVHELYGGCLLIQCEELRINHLTPLPIVIMPYACWFLWRVNYIEDFERCFDFHIGVAFWRAILREVYFWRAKVAFEGHCRLPILNTNREQALHYSLSWHLEQGRRIVAVAVGRGREVLLHVSADISAGSTFPHKLRG